MYHCNRFYKIKINTLVQDLVRLLMNARTCCAVAWTPSHFMPSLHVVALPAEATETAAFRAAAVWIRKEDDAAAQCVRSDPFLLPGMSSALPGGVRGLSWS